MRVRIYDVNDNGKERFVFEIRYRFDVPNDDACAHGG
jgi:hypothetical protein